MMYWNALNQLYTEMNRRAWTDTYDVLKFFVSFYLFYLFYSWTDTYDVLKSTYNPFFILFYHSWTDTYDVLKSNTFFCQSSKTINLNRHIWCIEILLTLELYCLKIILNRHIWCIEIFQSSILAEPLKLEPTHMMYWNAFSSIKRSNSRFLNRHIWCIEMSSAQVGKTEILSWTDTYDVLKSSPFLLSLMYIALNRHIWCIEIVLSYSFLYALDILNRHIWCIEIY